VYGPPLKTLGEVLGSWFSPSVKDGPWWLITAPVSFIIEMVARLTGIPEESVAYLNFKRDFGVLVWALVILLLAWVIYRKKGFIQKAMRETAFFPLFVGCVFHLFNYKTTGYLHAKYWYWIPRFSVRCSLLAFWWKAYCVGISVIYMAALLHRCWWVHSPSSWSSTWQSL
jgi:hypothetical protein